MSTKKLFEDNVYKKETDAKLLSVCSKKNGITMLTLDQTIFFPEGGGQSCDIGFIDDNPVLYVNEENGDIVHLVKTNFTSFKVGDTVHCTLDWSHRFDNMQRHCGEHILSGMFHREYGGVNRGFHMGDNYMTIDISLEDNPIFNKLTTAMALHVENCANMAIWANLPVVTRRFNTKAEANNLPLRKALTIEKNISIVCVGDINNPSDCVACCGTHPSNSGQVGLVKIFKVEKNKNMFRVYCEAGQRAMNDYDSKHQLLTTLSNKYSVSVENLAKKIDAQEKKHQNIKDELHNLRKTIRDFRASEISVSSKNFFRYDNLSINDAIYLGKNIKKPFWAILLTKEKTLFLFSDGNIDCNALIKRSPFKGGGNRSMSRATYSNLASIEVFINSLPFLI